MKRKIKILFIHHAAGWGGAPNSLIKIIERLDEHEYEVVVLLLKNSIVSKKLKEKNINYVIASSIFYTKFYSYFTHSEANYLRWYQVFKFLKLSVLWFLSRYYFSKEELKRHSFDIIHLNSSVLTDWLAPGKKRGKVVLHVREPFRKGRLDLLYRFFIRNIKNNTDKIIVISNDNKIRIGLPEKTKVIYNYSEIPKKSAPMSSYTSKKVLYLGGSAYIKGFYTLVEALDYLDEEITVYFGGNYSYSKKYSSFKIIRFLKNKRIEAIKKMKKHSNSIEIGMVSNVNDYLKKICCLISPLSVPHFSRPVIESYLFKKPVIGSDVSGMEEIIKHEKTGLIVPKNNARELAKAINYLCSDSKKAKEYGVNGYNYAKKRFSDRNFYKIIKIYEELTDL